MNLIRNLIFAFALTLISPTQPVFAQAASQPELAQSIQRHAEAWGSQDAERVAAQHSEYPVFRLFVDGTEAGTGRAAILAQFRQILSDNPSYRSTVRSVMFGSGFVVNEYDIHMDPPRPFAYGNTRYVPTGRAYAIPAIDIIYFKNGLVTVKHTYLDTTVIRANSRRTSRVSR